MSRPPIPVSAPPRVAERLRRTPDGPVRVVHSGPDAVYVDLAGWCLGLVSRHAAQVPCALRTRLDRLPVAPRVEVVAGVARLDGTPLVVGRLCEVVVPRRAGGGVTDLTPDDVGRLVGAGDGLTPYGDDVLCGWLAVRRAGGVATPRVDTAVRSLLARTTLLSATLLDCALHGEVLPEFAAYVGSLGRPDEAVRTADLLAVGHTSGAGLLEGARWALAA